MIENVSSSTIFNFKNASWPHYTLWILAEDKNGSWNYENQGEKMKIKQYLMKFSNIYI